MVFWTIFITKSWFFRYVLSSKIQKIFYNIYIENINLGVFVMAIYSDKICAICKDVYIPAGPKQKYCASCGDEGRKLANRVRDRKRSRLENNYQEYTRNCLVCGIEFKTYYKKKMYCGSEKCEKERISKKNKNTHLNRNVEDERIRKLWYYRTTKKDRLLQKAQKYREYSPASGPYAPGKVHRHSIGYVRSYVSKFGYKLLSNKYANNNSKIKLLCPENHEWETNFHNFKDNSARCLYCYIANNYTSKPEQKIFDYFMDNYKYVEVIHNDRKQISPLEIDVYFPNHKLGIEVCGLYWHSEISGGKKRSYHYNKMMKCLDKDIRLITIFEDEIRDKFEIVMSRVLTALGLLNNKIYARKCEVKDLLISEANSFFDGNHIQGRSAANKAWGLFYDGDLVSACSIGKVGRKHAGGEDIIELKRFCSKIGCSVVGGFSKLFKLVLSYCSSNNVSILKSYCDMRYANIFNPIYEKVGFKLHSFTKYTPHYVKNGKRYRNMSLCKTPDERLTGKTEFELRCAQGYDRIWDCGHRTYIYEIMDKKV